jgi:hypothetical protein
MRFKALADLPQTHLCRACKETKPISEMIVIHERKTGKYLLRARCKDCQNEQERGHRRQWKRDYLRRWRKRNARLNESYWRQRSALKREEISGRARRRYEDNRHAILIQGRLRRHGEKVSLAEAMVLLKKYGPCYPQRPGLTPEGLQECERIRGTYRRHGHRISAFQIRLMVYEDGFFIKPARQQKEPYRASAKKLRDWHESRRNQSEVKAA